VTHRRYSHCSNDSNQQAGGKTYQRADERK